MSSPQFSVRIPSTLNEQVKEFAEANNITKTKVMIDALKHYLGCMEGIALNQQLSEIKKLINELKITIEEK